MVLDSSLLHGPGAPIGRSTVRGIGSASPTKRNFTHFHALHARRKANSVVLLDAEERSISIAWNNLERPKTLL